MSFICISLLGCYGLEITTIFNAIIMCHLLNFSSVIVMSLILVFPSFLPPFSSFFCVHMFGTGDLVRPSKASHF